MGRDQVCLHLFGRGISPFKLLIAPYKEDTRFFCISWQFNYSFGIFVTFA